MKTLADLYDHMLRDVYHAEKQVYKLLPKLKKAVTDQDLADTIGQEREAVAERIAVLEEGFEALGKRPRGVPCEAMIGLVEEASEVLEDAEEEAINAGVLAAYQAIKHYEITRFGTLGAWSNRLGNVDMAAKFGGVVDAAKLLDERLTVLAEGQVNPAADEGQAEPSKGGSKAAKSTAKTSK